MANWPLLGWTPWRLPEPDGGGMKPLGPLLDIGELGFVGNGGREFKLPGKLPGFIG